MFNLKRVIEVVIKGTDTSGPIWSNLSGRIRGLISDKAKLAAAAGIVAVAVTRMVSTLVRKYDEAIGKAGEMQQAVAEVNTLLGTDDAAVASMTKRLQDLAVKYGQVDTVMARAQYNVASAGFADVADSIHILDVASRAAIAGVTDVNTAAKTITQVLNAYGKGADQAEQVSGYLFSTIKGGVTTFEELSGTLGKVTATAAAAKIPFEQVASAMAVLTKNGANSAEAATALNALILAIGAASGDSKKQLDELGINLDNGLGPALVAVGNASGGALDKLAEMIPNIRAIRAAASAASDSGVAFAEQIKAMANGVEDFNNAYAIMSKTLEQAQARLDAAEKRRAEAIGRTGLEGKTAAVQGLADSVNQQARAVENSNVTLTKWATTWGKIKGAIEKADGATDAFMVQGFNTWLAAVNGDADSLRQIFENLTKAEEQARLKLTAMATAPTVYTGNQPDGPLGPSSPEVVAEQAKAATRAALEAAAKEWDVATADTVFDPEKLTWIDVPRASKAIADDITAAYKKAGEILVDRPPVLPKDFSPLENDNPDPNGDQVLLLEDLMALEQERADQLKGYYGDGDAERLANLNGFMTPEQIAKADAEFQKHLKAMTSMGQEQRVVSDAAKDVGDNFERLASNSLSAMFQANSGAIMFGRTLRTVVMDALAAVLAKLIKIQSIKLFAGLFGNGGTVEKHAHGGAVHAAYGYTVPESGARIGMDSVPILAMPGEEVIDRSLSLGLRRFLAAQDTAGAASVPAGAGGGRSVTVVQQVGRPISYMDVLNVGEQAVVAARKVAEANL